MSMRPTPYVTTWLRLLISISKMHSFIVRNAFTSQSPSQVHATVMGNISYSARTHTHTERRRLRHVHRTWLIASCLVQIDVESTADKCLCWPLTATISLRIAINFSWSAIVYNCRSRVYTVSDVDDDDGDTAFHFRRVSTFLHSINICIAMDARNWNNVVESWFWLPPPADDGY